MEFRRVFLAALMLTALLSVAQAEMRNFSNSKGDAIEAELVSHKNGKVKLRRADGVEFEVVPTVFSPEDQAYIKSWMDKNPASVDYAFRIEAERKKLAGTMQDLGYKRVKNEKWAYQIKITNHSRDTVKDLTVKYKVFYSNRADGEFSASSGDVKEMAQIRGEAKLKSEMEFNQTMEFTTKSATIDFVDYDGAGSRYKDTLRGAMIRILDKQGKIVADWVMPMSYLKKKTWDNTEPRKNGSGGESQVIIR